MMAYFAYQCHRGFIYACLSVAVGMMGSSCVVYAKLPPQIAPIVTTPQPSEILTPPDIAPVKHPLVFMTPLEALIEANRSGSEAAQEGSILPHEVTPQNSCCSSSEGTPYTDAQKQGADLAVKLQHVLHHPVPHADQPPQPSLVPQVPSSGHHPTLETTMVKIHSLSIEGASHYKPSFILWRLGGLAQGQVLSLATLQQRVLRLNALEPGLKTALHLTQPDPSRTDVDVVIKVFQKTPYQLAFTADNQGRPLIGMYRGGVIASHDTVLGYGDKLQLHWVGGGQTSQGRMTYDVPITVSGGRFLAWGELGRVTTEELPGKTYGLENQGTQMSFGFNLVQPLNTQRTWQWEAGYTNRHAFTTVEGFRDPTVNTRILATGVRYLNKDKYGQVNGYVGGQYQPKWLGTNFTFWTIRSQLLRTLEMPHQQRLTFRGGMQLTNTPLPAASQVIYGGAYTVRGYTEGMVTADRGLQASLEYQAPFWGVQRVSPWLADRTAWVAFVDMSHAWYDASHARFALAGTSRRAGQLLGVGLGVRYRLTPYLQGFVDAGFPLVRSLEALSLNGQPTMRLHFGVRSHLVQRTWK
ncbi:MAG: ShlB/FhaC/HecB family hemolysin secretion/activation protein [Vampirovibrionales bacterium]